MEIRMNESNLEIKLSKEGFPVPVVNGIHLHSIYNPQREAETLASKFEDTIKSKSTILILGLGLGYHVHTVLSHLSKYFEEYQVAVIEPNSELVDYVTSENLVDQRYVEIYSSQDLDQLYANTNLIDILRSQPGIITHPPSFNINESFYRQFLSYKAPKQIKFLRNTCQQNQLKDFFDQFDQNLTFEGISKDLQISDSPLSEEDMLFIALENMCNNSQTTNTEVGV